ncbi:DUF1634 domain-containing protein [Meiothermus sp.]|uniref:DUF1634 domain-containing protein n=1 Tax=Meiothermus sp. TaxID=1955249 RepID=UPI0021DE9870|nr:DUF1634 domain-containing protein [Meiothermus sp.]GIW35197.1 MAG: hypothetical protein KatS3mg072_2530 [Meiothermus sp.]
MNDRQMELFLGNLLRVGLFLAGGVVLLGGVLELMHHGYDVVRFDIFRGESAGLRSLDGIWNGIIAGQPRALIQLGILLLVATPLLRVAVSAFLFARQKDAVFSTITLVVLCILLYSLNH